MAMSLSIWPEPRRRVDGGVVLSTTLEWPGGGRDVLWYRVPEKWAEGLTLQLDPFAIALTMLAMHRRVDLKFRGRVSPSLLANLEEFQSIWQFWKPDTYTKVDIAADEEAEAEPAGAGSAIVSFSGGVDACYTVYRHVNVLAGRRTMNVRAGLLVEGFDIPLGDPAFAVAEEGAKRLLSSVDVPLISAATNWRELEQRHRLNWTDSFGSAIISSLSLFSAHFGVGMLGSGDRYYNIRPHGSTPLTDPLLGSDSFSVRNDGGAASRVEKVGLVSEWQQALRDLRVCWEGEHRGRNCSRCEKCVRTILNFRVIGRPLPPCFEHDVTLEQIRSIPIDYTSQLEELQSIVAHAALSGREAEPWIQALADRITRHLKSSGDLTLLPRVLHRLRQVTRVRQLLTPIM